MTTHKITPEILRAIVPTMPLAKRNLYAPLMTAAMIEFGVTTYLRAAAFLAECAEETDHFRTLEEYATGAEYDHRADLGNTKPQAIRIAHAHATTPGRFWKGHGALQTTGFNNHEEVGEALGLDLINNPRLAAEPENAFRVAGYFWKKHNLNRYADARQIRAVSGVINAGNAEAAHINGLAERIRLYNEALRALPDDFLLGEDATFVADDSDADYSRDDMTPPVVTLKIGKQSNAPEAADSPSPATDQPLAPAPAPAPDPKTVAVPVIPPAPPAAPEPEEDQGIAARANKIATQVKAWHVAIPSGVATFGVAVYKWATDPAHEALIFACLGGAVLIVVVFVIFNFRHSALKARLEAEAKQREHELTMKREDHAFELTKLQAETAADKDAATIQFVTPEQPSA